MREAINSCGRAEELVTYLYGEATADEARDFEGHLRQCAACRTELADFGGAREAIGDWRLQALGPLAHTAVEPDAPLLFNAAETRKRRPASALAALREFFALSTAWMRAATVAVAVAFCALVVIAVAHFVERPQTVVVEEQIKSGYSQEEVEDMIAAAVKRQKESGEKEQAEPEKIQVASRNRRERRGAQPQMAGDTRPRLRAPRPSAQPSTEVASTDYLPFTAGQEDEEGPSLADIVDDASQE